MICYFVKQSVIIRRFIVVMSRHHRSVIGRFYYITLPIAHALLTHGRIYVYYDRKSCKFVTFTTQTYNSIIYYNILEGGHCS